MNDRKIGIHNLAVAAVFGVSLLVVSACSSWDGSVGAVFARDNPSGRVFVRDAPADMGAAQAGVLVGDELIAVDGHPVAPMNPNDLHKILSGKVGSKVKLQVKRNGRMLDYTVERSPLRQAP